MNWLAAAAIANQSAISSLQSSIEKGATEAPFYYGRGRRLPFLAGLLLPALGFLRHCLLSPPSCGINGASAHAHRSWLPPGTLTPMSALVAWGTFRCVGRASSNCGRASLGVAVSKPPSYQM